MSRQIPISNALERRDRKQKRERAGKHHKAAPKRTRIFRLLAVLLLITGIGVIVYPHVVQRIYSHKAAEDAAIFDDKMSDMRQSDNPDDRRALAELLAYMQKYNQEIYSTHQEGLVDAWAYEGAAFDLRSWGFEDNVFGYVSIPTMDVILPIYLGATMENMDEGIVQLGQTSVPIGGTNTNCVLAGHRGCATAAMFRDIENLSIGDEVSLSNPWETLSYQVVETRIIDPSDFNQILIQEGRDMITLITCHPFSINNKRYVVYCERADGK